MHLNISRTNKSEATSTHLSPVKKRVKENTPPDTLRPEDVAFLQDWTSSLRPSKSGREPRQTIVIADTPSPTPSIITISSDSDDDGETKYHRGRR